MSADVTYIIDIEMQAKFQEQLEAVRVGLASASQSTIELKNHVKSLSSSIVELPKNYEELKSSLTKVISTTNTLNKNNEEISRQIKLQVENGQTVVQNYQREVDATGLLGKNLELVNQKLITNNKLQADLVAKTSEINNLTRAYKDFSEFDKTRTIQKPITEGLASTDYFKKMNDDGTATLATLKSINSEIKDISVTTRQMTASELKLFNISNVENFEAKVKDATNLISQITKESLEVQKSFNAVTNETTILTTGITKAGDSISVKMKEVDGSIKDVSTSLKQAARDAEGLTAVARKQKELEDATRRSKDILKEYQQTMAKMREMKDYSWAKTEDKYSKDALVTMKAINKEGKEIEVQVRKQAGLWTDIINKEKTSIEMSKQRRTQIQQTMTTIQQMQATMTELSRIEKVDASGLTTTTITAKDANNLKNLSATWKTFNGEIVDATYKTGQYNKTLAGMDNEIKKVTLSWESMLRIGAVQLTHRAVASVISEIRSSINEAKELQILVSQIQTISQQDLGFGTWQSRIREISNETAISAQNIAQATYDAISNQIADGERALQFMRTAGKFAVATQTSMTDSVNLLSSALNSFNLEAEQAEYVANVFFKTFFYGRVVAKDMANDFGRIAQMANLVGVSFEELNAYIATTTIQGVKFSNVSTMLTNVLGKLIKPSKEMDRILKDMGYDSGQAIIAANGLVGTMAALEKATHGSANEMAQVFNDVRGFKGFAAIVGSNLKLFAENVDNITDSTDAMNNAFDTVANTAGFKLNQELEKIKNYFAQDWGNWIVEVAGFANEWISLSSSVGAVVDKVTKLVTILAVFKGTQYLFGAQASWANLASSVNAISLGFGSAAIEANKATISVNSFAGALQSVKTIGMNLPFVVGGLAAIGIGAYSIYNEIRAAFDQIGNSYKEAMKMTETYHKDIMFRFRQEAELATKVGNQQIRITRQLLAERMKVANQRLELTQELGDEALKKYISGLRDFISQYKSGAEKLNTIIDNSRKSIEESAKWLESFGKRIQEIKLQFRLDTAQNDISKQLQIYKEDIDRLTKEKIAIDAKIVPTIEPELLKTLQAQSREISQELLTSVVRMKALSEQSKTEAKNAQERIKEIERDLAEIKDKDAKKETKSTTDPYEMRAIQREREAQEDKVKKLNEELALLKTRRAIEYDVDVQIDKIRKSTEETEAKILEIRKQQSELAQKELADRKTNLKLLDSSYDELAKIKMENIVSPESFDLAKKRIGEIKKEIQGIEVGTDTDMFSLRKDMIEKLSTYEYQLAERNQTLLAQQQIKNAEKATDEFEKYLKNLATDEIGYSKILADAKTSIKAMQDQLSGLSKATTWTGFSSVDRMVPQLNELLRPVFENIEKNNFSLASKLFEEIKTKLITTTGAGIQDIRSVEELIRELAQREPSNLSPGVDITNLDASLKQSASIQERMIKILEDTRNGQGTTEDALKRINEAFKTDLKIENMPSYDEIKNEMINTDAYQKTMLPIADAIAGADGLRALTQQELDVLRNIKEGINNLKIEVTTTPVEAEGKAYGGWIRKGGNSFDTVPTMLAPGEFVVNRFASRQFSGLLESINRPNINNSKKMDQTFGDINITVNSQGKETDLAAIQHGLSRAIRRKVWSLQ